MLRDNIPLRIAQIAPLAERVPPKMYGGTERVVYALTEELVRLGHDVTLFASGDSITSAKLFSVYPRGLRETKVTDHYGLKEWTLCNVGAAYKRQRKFDIIHDHNHVFGLPLAHFSKTPTLTTIHGAITPGAKRLLEIFDRPPLITISKAQGQMFPNLKILDTVYNGLNMKDYPFSDVHDGYLLYVGRISMEKGLHHAIDVAQSFNLPLIIAAKLDKADIEYFNTYIKQRIDGKKIRWVGEVDQDTRNQLMSKAICLLHPVTWPEPFGLTMIEAMATGCPIVAFDRGSIPEIVSHAKTGFVVHNIEEMINAVRQIRIINRRECRIHALKNFNARIMTKKYLNIYYELIENSKVFNRFSYT